MVGSDKVKNMFKKKFPSLSSLGSDGNTSFLRAARAGHLDKVLEQLRNSVDINTSNANGLNALHLASKDGHVHVVTELLKRGANVDSATKKGNTALHIASLAGQEEVVRLLVEHGASVNVQSQNGFTPLYMAAQENHDNVVKYLLANGANQSLATEDGFTPLAVAMQQGHDKVVAVLLENDTRGKVRLPALHIAAKKDDCKAAALLLQNEHNPDVTSKSGFTPLHIASHYGNEGIANLLLNKGADVNYSAKHNITPLHVAAKWGKSNMVSLLLEKGANIESKTRDGLTPLHCAARSGHEQVVDMLLERGAPISSKTKNGLAPLHMSSQGDHVDAARILLYHRAPVDEVTVDYLTALHVAAHCGHARVAKLLLDRKADPNARALNGFTPLHIACKKNRIKVVELLLKHGASIEATTESGLTPLHVASFMGCMNIVIYLLQNEANPDVPTVRGETPLHLAARANQTDIIRILLRNGAQVDARAREQQTPLHIASRLGNVDIVMLLLQHGAAVDCTTKDLYSALHIAAKEGQDEVASVLLENGASPTATTKKGFTPLHLAAKYGNMKVARLLLQRDAPVDAQGKNGVTPLHVASHYDHQNVALLLLDKGASPHATAKNGHTPLHIAAKKNQMDIATTLLEYGAKANAESKAGFTPLHLSAQEGHMDMSSLLIDHQADTNHKAKNGLTPLHLCAQEDRVNVASVLVKNGAEVEATTKAGYTPLHVACHFGQLNMVKFLLDEGSKVGASTAVGYTPLHQAAQQGHCAIINTLLEHGAPPNATTNQGQTAMSIAQKLGYISVVETLKGVTEPTITPSGLDEKYKVVSPETMQETFMSDSEDEGGEDTLLSEQPYRYLTVDEMKSLGDDSLPIDVRQDERVDSNRECMTVPPTAVDDTISPQHLKEAYSQFTTPDNIDISKHPLHVGFLVSFLVDARGGAMRGCRHSGVRVIVPPRRASMPMRVTCRYLKRDKLTHPPPLMEGEALASRILELGPVGAKFLGPVMIEVPHFGSLRGKEREIVILRSDNGETWREHTVDCSEEAVQDVLSHSFDKEDIAQMEDNVRTTRILTTDFPHYFAVVTRVRQEVHAIGPEGGMVSSSVVPQVQAVFPQGALTKKIKVGLQAQPISAELAAKLLGNRVAVSPIVTVEPRRRKFHKPITLTIPKPQAANKGMINQYSGDAPTLRLLCSITGGTTRAQWEDVTGSTPFTFVNDCVSFTTTVSARFWLMDCRNVGDATKMATELYREAIHVPFMAKFVVFAKRVDPLEARLRIFCMTDDKEDKTLEHQEHFTEVAKSRDVEVLEGKTQYIEFAGNLVPVTKSGEQLQLGFRAFRENRLPFTVRVKDPHADCIGRTLFMREARLPKGEPPQQPICVLNIVLPEEIIPEAILPEHELHKYSFIQDSSGLESYQRVDLRLSDISNLLGADWVRLADELGVATSDINRLKTEHPQSVAQQGLAMLRLWLSQAGNKAQASTLESALNRLGRDDIVQQCVFNVDHSGIQLLKDESHDASIRRSIPYSDKDLMKDSESVEDLSRAILRKTDDIIEKDDKEERKYEAEEKEVEEEKKSVSERRKEIERMLSLDRLSLIKTETINGKTTTDKGEDFSEKEIAEEKSVSSPEDEPSELTFAQKRLSFEQGKRVIEMKPDKTTMKEVKERADDRFLAEERRAAELQEEKKSKVDETAISFQEKRKSFEQGFKEEKEKDVETKKEDLRRDSALFEGVSQGLVRLDAAFTAAPQVQDLLSPKVSKTPPPSPAEFKDLTGTVAWTEEPSAVVPTKPDQSQDWADKRKPDSPIDSTITESSKILMKKENEAQLQDNSHISVTSRGSLPINDKTTTTKEDNLNKLNVDKESKYQFTMSVPNKQVFIETRNSMANFLENEKDYSGKMAKNKSDRTIILMDEVEISTDEILKSGEEPKSGKSFMGKVSKKLFGVFKKDDKEKIGKRKEKKIKSKIENEEQDEDSHHTIIAEKHDITESEIKVGQETGKPQINRETPDTERCTLHDITVTTSKTVPVSEKTEQKINIVVDNLEEGKKLMSNEKILVMEDLNVSMADKTNECEKTLDVHETYRAKSFEGKELKQTPDSEFMSRKTIKEDCESLDKTEVPIEFKKVVRDGLVSEIGTTLEQASGTTRDLTTEVSESNIASSDCGILSFNTIEPSIENRETKNSITINSNEIAKKEKMKSIFTNNKNQESNKTNGMEVSENISIGNTTEEMVDFATAKLVEPSKTVTKIYEKPKQHFNLLLREPKVEKETEKTDNATSPQGILKETKDCLAMHETLPERIGDFVREGQCDVKSTIESVNEESNKTSLKLKEMLNDKKSEIVQTSINIIESSKIEGLNNKVGEKSEKVGTASGQINQSISEIGPEIIKTAKSLIEKDFNLNSNSKCVSKPVSVDTDTVFEEDLSRLMKKPEGVNIPDNSIKDIKESLKIYSINSSDSIDKNATDVENNTELVSNEDYSRFAKKEPQIKTKIIDPNVSPINIVHESIPLPAPITNTSVVITNEFNTKHEPTSKFDTENIKESEIEKALISGFVSTPKRITDNIKATDLVYDLPDDLKESPQESINENKFVITDIPVKKLSKTDLVVLETSITDMNKCTETSISEPLEVKSNANINDQMNLQNNEAAITSNIQQVFDGITESSLKTVCASITSKELGNEENTKLKDLSLPLASIYNTETIHSTTKKETEPWSNKVLQTERSIKITDDHSVPEICKTVHVTESISGKECCDSVVTKLANEITENKTDNIQCEFPLQGDIANVKISEDVENNTTLTNNFKINGSAKNIQVELDTSTNVALNLENTSHLENVIKNQITVDKNDCPDTSQSNDEKLNNLLIDMLIEQECMNYSNNEFFNMSSSKSDQSYLSEQLDEPEKSDIEVSEKSPSELKEGESFKSVASFGQIEDLISDANLKRNSEKYTSGQSPYVTTPTMQRRKIGGSQRLSREERPALREVSHMIDYSSSEEDEINSYIVTEPCDQIPKRKVTFHVESEDEVLKVSDSNSEPEIEVTEMTPSPDPTSIKQERLSAEKSSKSLGSETKNKSTSHKNNRKVEQRFQRMASETLDGDPVAKFTADREFQRMVSQLSNEEVDACLNQWDEEGLTPSEELDSTRDTNEGDLDTDVEALPEASLASTNPFYTTSSQWVGFEHEIRDVPSLFWAFNTAQTSSTIQPNELDIPVKSKIVKGDSAGEESKKDPSPATVRENEEALLDLATGLQDTKGSGAGSSSSSTQ